MDQPQRDGVFAVGAIYDRTRRSLHGLPDTAETKPATYQRIHPVLEVAESFIIATVRHRELGDTVFVEYTSPEGLVRIALPPGVTSIIARQHESLTRTNRKKSAKAEAARRKAAGIVPGFMKRKKKL